jgi:hypothetical protein
MKNDNIDDFLKSLDDEDKKMKVLIEIILEQKKRKI